MPAAIGSLADLTAAQAAGQRVEYVYFWGHRPETDGRVGPGCLSQWWPAPFTVDGLRFATAEHYMMWCKATLFGDDAVAERILTAAHPRAAKALGAAVRNFDQQTWEQRRVPIVVAGNVAKFGESPALRAFLLGTGQRILVEASPVDRVWGIGLNRGDPAATDPERWRGLNLLGFALMQVREILKDGPES